MAWNGAVRGWSWEMRPRRSLIEPQQTTARRNWLMMRTRRAWTLPVQGGPFISWWARCVLFCLRCCRALHFMAAMVRMVHGIDTRWTSIMCIHSELLSYITPSSSHSSLTPPSSLTHPLCAPPISIMSVSMKPIRRAKGWGGGGRVFDRKLEVSDSIIYNYFDVYQEIGGRILKCFFSCNLTKKVSVYNKTLS